MTEERTVGFEPTASSLESWRSTYRATPAWRPLYQTHPANVSARRHILYRPDGIFFLGALVNEAVPRSDGAPGGAEGCGASPPRGV